MDAVGASPPRHRNAASPGSASTPPGLVQTTPDLDADEQRPSSDGNNESPPDPPHTPTNLTTEPLPPPFWTPRHERTTSAQSLSQLRRLSGPIQLEDHSEEDHVQAQSCWAESASVDEYVVVSGPTGIGAYVVWHCTVRTLKGGDLEIRKRYSEFDALRTNLVRAFPHAEAMIPELPRKSVVSRFRPRFLEARKRGLGHFLNCILLNPEFASSPVLKDFVFS